MQVSFDQKRAGETVLVTQRYGFDCPFVVECRENRLEAIQKYSNLWHVIYTYGKCVGYCVGFTDGNLVGISVGGYVLMSRENRRGVRRSRFSSLSKHGMPITHGCPVGGYVGLYVGAYVGLYVGA